MFNYIFREARFGIILVDMKTERIPLINAYSRDLLQFTGQENDIFHLITSLFIPDMEMDSILADNESERRIFWNNKLISCRITAPLKNILCLFLVDVTEKAHLESIAEAVNIMDNIGYIFSGIRHEIGNPLNTIKMTMTVLKKNIQAFPADTIETYVNRTLEEILRLEELLQSLKSYNMFDKPKPLTVDIPAFLGKFFSLIGQDFSRKGVRIKTSFSLRARNGYIDPRALQQVLLNIFTNALDAFEKQKFPEISISTYKTGNRVWIKIRDNGRGMSEDNLRNLFKPFYTTKPKGTGLGLVITRKILTKQDCTIDIYSRENHGTAVLISLPEGVDEGNESEGNHTNNR